MKSYRLAPWLDCERYVSYITDGWDEPEYRVKFVQWNKDNASWTWVERDEFDEEG